MKPYLTPIAMVLAAGLTLAGCNKSPQDKAADAVRDQANASASNVDAAADAAAATASDTSSAAAAGAKATADAMHDQADAIKDNGKAKADAIEDGKVGAVTTSTTTDGDTTKTEKVVIKK